MWHCLPNRKNMVIKTSAGAENLCCFLYKHFVFSSNDCHRSGFINEAYLEACCVVYHSRGCQCVYLEICEVLWLSCVFSSLCLHSNGQSNSLWPLPFVGSPTGSASSWPSSCTAVLPRWPGALSVAYPFWAPPPYLLTAPRRPITSSNWKVRVLVVTCTSHWPSWPCCMSFTWWSVGTASPRRPCWLMLNSRYVSKL